MRSSAASPGFVASGCVRPGSRITVLPSGEETTVARIVTYDGDLDRAVAGQSVTLVLADEIDVSRGDVLCAAAAPARVGERFSARLFWMAADPLRPGASFLLKLGTRTVAATVAAVSGRIDLEALGPRPALSLESNDVGDVVIALDRPVSFDAYEDSRETGGFILIDREGGATVGIGLVRAAETEAAASEGARSGWLAAAREKPWRSLAKTMTWRTAGTLGTLLFVYLFTHDARISVAVGAVEVLTKCALYFGHERLWSRLRFGLQA